jgi:hypothetical protein
VIGRPHAATFSALGSFAGSRRRNDLVDALARGGMRSFAGEASRENFSSKADAVKVYIQTFAPVEQV